MSNVHVLLVGFNSGVLDALDAAGVTDVVVVEEPDLWHNKGLAPKAETHPCLVGVQLAEYQQSLGYRDLVDQYVGRVLCVVPGLEYAVSAAADLAERLGVAGASSIAAQILRDKLELRSAQVGSGLREIDFREVRSERDVSAFLVNHPHAVLKPANRQASLGVRLLGPGDDVRAAWEATIGADEGRQVARRAMRWRYIVEERLVGQELSVEALVRDGRVLWVNPTRKTTIGGASPVELGHVVGFPAGPWSARMQQLVSAVGYDTGVLHAEWMEDGDSATLIECAGRPPGDHITELIDHAYGVNFLALWVQMMQGHDPSGLGTATSAAAVRFIVPPQPGTVRAVEGLDAAKASPGVVEASVTASPGDQVHEVSSSWDRIGFVIAVGDSPEVAEARASAAERQITITVE